MKKYILRMRETDKFVFDAIKKGKKTVETRAATERYRKIQTEDTLVFVCGKEKIERKAGSVKHFASINEMAKKIDFKKIMPFCKNIEEVKNVYYSFPGYKEKIKKFGILVFNLKPVKT